MQKEKLEKRKEFIINILYYAIIAILAFLCIHYVAKWLLPFILGFVIAVAVNPPISVVCKKTKISRKFFALFFLVLVYGLIVLILWGLGALIYSSLRDFFTNLPSYYDSSIVPFLESIEMTFHDITSRISPETLDQIHSVIENTSGNLRDYILNFSTGMVSTLANASTKLPYFFISFIFTILASLFISMDYERIVAFIRKQLPPRINTFILDAKEHFGKTILRYLRAYLIIWIITFSELSIGLSILKVDSAVGLAALIALTDILPVFGTGTVLWPWAIFSLFSQNYYLAIGLVVLYLIILVIRNFIEPKIVGDQLGLNPVVTLVAIYIGYLWLGVSGMIILPICTTIIVGLHRLGKIHLWKE